MAAGKNFHWVEINKDYQPELAVEKFHVSAYPTCMVLNEKLEKVHRFQSFQKPPEFVAQLDEGLKRFALYKDGKEWDTPNPRPEQITAEAQVTTLQSPSKKVPAGFAFLSGEMWVGFMGQLFALDPETGAVKRSFDLTSGITDIDTDGKVLYGAESGWTAGKPIYEIDPATGQSTRSIITAANEKNRSHGAKGVAWVDGKLYALEGVPGKISEIDLQTGEVTRSLKIKESYITGLAWDGRHFVVGSRKELLLVRPDDGEIVRRVKVNYPIRSVGYHNGVYYVMEQPIFGFDKNHKNIQVWPQNTLVYKLVLPEQQASEANAPK